MDIIRRNITTVSVFRFFHWLMEFLIYMDSYFFYLLSEILMCHQSFHQNQLLFMKMSTKECSWRILGCQHTRNPRQILSNYYGVTKYYMYYVILIPLIKCPPLIKQSQWLDEGREGGIMPGFLPKTKLYK